MAVTFDTSATSVTTQGGTSPLAWAHTCGATADFLLAAMVIDNGTNGTPATNPITAMTYNAVSMGTALLNWQAGGASATSGYLAVFGLASPATGSAHNVSSSYTTTNVDECIGGSASFITGGGSLGTPAHSDSNGAAVTSGSITIATASANSLVVVFVTNGSGGTAFTSGTSRFISTHSGTAAGGAGSVNCATIPGTGGNVTVNWTQTSDYYAAIAVEVLPGGGAPVAYSPPGAVPGRTWRRQFKHPQTPPVASFVAPSAPAPAGNNPGGVVVYRRPARSIWGGVLAQPGQPLVNGTVQPKPVIARRTAARGQWRGTLTVTVNATPGQAVSGTVPPHLTVARRTAARAAWRGLAVPPRAAAPATGGLVRRRTAARGLWGGQSTPQPHVPGQVQPRAAIPVPRRASARAAWRALAGPGNASGPAGTVQPRAAIPVPRRTASRAAWRQVTGPANAHGAAGQQPHGFTSSRRPVGGLWGGSYTPQPNASGPSGSVQPRATVQVPRRAAARGWWRGTITATVNAALSGPAGSVQPRATVPLPRRYPARAGLWRGQSTPQPHLPGQVQPKTTVPVPRRSAARGLWRSALGALNASGPAGTVQPRVTVPVPRRAAARVLWHSAAGPGNAHGPSGAVQPHLTVARRAAARAVTHWTPATTTNGAASPPVSGTVQPAATRQPRRVPARAVWRGAPVATVNAVPPPAGMVQPKATVPVPRRNAERVIWRGNAVPGQQPQPATGGLVKRRSTARGLWHGAAGSPPPPPAPGTPTTGGRIVTRRPPSRGQWHGNAGPGNAHGPAVPAPGMRPRITSRAATRGQWQGTITTAGYRHTITLWQVTGARQLWTTGTARQLWRTGTARN